MDSLIRSTFAAVLLCAAFAGSACAQTSTQPSAELPSPQDLIARCLEAMGGEQAFDAVETAETTIHSATPVGDYDIRVFWAADGSLRMEVGDQTQPPHFGARGEIVWNWTPETGYRVFEGAQADGMRAQLIEFILPFVLPKMLQSQWSGSTLETVRAAEFAGVPCYEVRVTGSDEAFQLAYFNRDTALFVGKSQEAKNPLTETVETFEAQYLDYQRFGSFTTLTRAVILQGSVGRTEMTYKDIKLNAVDPARFEVPAEVETEVARRKAESDAAEDRDAGGGGT